MPSNSLLVILNSTVAALWMTFGAPRTFVSSLVVAFGPARAALGTVRRVGSAGREDRVDSAAELSEHRMPCLTRRDHDRDLDGEHLTLGVELI